MSTVTVVQDWLSDIGPRERTALVARIHIAAETSPATSADHICSTVARDAFFAAPVRTRAGNELPEGSVLVDFEQVHGYYSKRAEGYVVTANDELKTVTTDWYMLTESAATLEGTGDIGGVDAKGKQFVVNSVVLFPAAPDGIRSEIAVTRYPFADIVSGDAKLTPPRDDSRRHLPVAEMDHAALVDQFIFAALNQQWDQMGTLLSEGHTTAFRIDGRSGSNEVHRARNRSEALLAFQSLFAGAEDLTVLTRVATDWYVFAEYLIRRPDGLLRRFAAIHSIDDLQFISTFGYGFDEGG
jgi:hypothetical protein